jgi:hypothetical protein
MLVVDPLQFLTQAALLVAWIFLAAAIYALVERYTDDKSGSPGS